MICPRAVANSNSFSATANAMQATDVESLRAAFVNHLEYSLAKDEFSVMPHDCFVSLALVVRDHLIERWIETQQTYYKQRTRRVYYLSLEFLMGRALGNGLINLGLYEKATEALRSVGYDLEEIREAEFDAGLGNGGLGRLAACFLDSMATLELPAYGYGIRYEYGIFFQHIHNGYQVETPDNWLRYGNPWEIARPEVLFSVKFYGQVHQYSDEKGVLRNDWLDTQEVMAMAYDTPIPGYRNNTVNTLRLWSAKATREFNLELFNRGAYEEAVAERSHTETISRVLYPNDSFFMGRELRLKQQYFFVSATLQDIVRRYVKSREFAALEAGHLFDNFAKDNVIQLNATHPSIGIAELMRILVDNEGLDWDKAWNVTVATFAYTNHTVLPEALEHWPVSLLERVLPRHLQIIYEINRRFLQDMEKRYPGDVERLRRLSLIAEDGEKRVRMANLAIVGSHAVNGVAALHSQILQNQLFHDFYEVWPEKFSNKTNGITPRRWLRACNPDLSTLITQTIGEGWVRDSGELKKLESHADDTAFQEAWRAAKRANKMRLAHYVADQNGVVVDVDSLFDCQVKRIHEYKRQLLNALHLMALYQHLKSAPNVDFVPRTVVIGGKAAPSYKMAKLIIKLITAIGEVVNKDPQIAGRLKVIFLANYGVSLAEKIIPAADLSQQISTAGLEASGTGNMKFALNGALTIGTLNGANIEIKEDVGDEIIFIFGLDAGQVQAHKWHGYDPWAHYHADAELKNALDLIDQGHFSPGEPDLFKPIVHALLHGGDPYFVLADFRAYAEAQEQGSTAYRDIGHWTKMSILNCARMGKFSSDRTISEYARDIWKVESVPVHI